MYHEFTVQSLFRLILKDHDLFALGRNIISDICPEYLELSINTYNITYKHLSHSYKIVNS